MCAKEREMETAGLDTEELLCLGEQMVKAVEAKSYTKASFWEDIRTALFDASRFCEEGYAELLNVIDGLQKRIEQTQHALDEARKIDQSSLSQEELQKERYQLLQREMAFRMQERSVQITLENLINQRQALQSQKELAKKLDAEIQRNQTVMALCASTFRLIASDGGSGCVAGSVVDSKGCVIDTFEFNKDSMDDFSVTEKLWNLQNGSQLGDGRV
ncbi:hypothetical protein KP509_18G004700 [Ceratopteris richardii]|uniref:Uncharacterized protein n=1 Tax=Ceratopteris richardii TaxID=49495 RepID=A0A8T2SP73_CERRI|nr:hypothetical protein KP509_18G004700 [Ceratopteris richardii]